MNLRVQSALVLGSLAQALLTSPASLDLRNAISRRVARYIDSYRRTPSNCHPLQEAFSACLKNTHPSNPAEGSTWALSTIASIIVLSGPHIFNRPRSLKLVVNAIALTRAQKVVRPLHPATWKCLVWAYAQLSVWPVVELDSEEGETFDERCFQMVNEVFSGDVPIALVGVLLGTEPSQQQARRGAKALKVVKELVARGGERRDVGIALLHRLLGGVGSLGMGGDGSTSNIIPHALLDGTLLNAKWECLGEAIDGMSHFGVDAVRILDETEMLRDWSAMLGIWQDCVSAAPRDVINPLPVSSSIFAP